MKMKLKMVKNVNFCNASISYFYKTVKVIFMTSLFLKSAFSLIYVPKPHNISDIIKKMLNFDDQTNCVGRVKIYYISRHNIADINVK